MHVVCDWLGLGTRDSGDVEMAVPLRVSRVARGWSSCDLESEFWTDFFLFFLCNGVSIVGVEDHFFPSL